MKIDHALIMVLGLTLVVFGLSESLGNPFKSSAKLDIICYSCGGVIYENTVDAEDYKLPDSGGVRFLDKKTGSWVNLSADCVVKELK